MEREKWGEKSEKKRERGKNDENEGNLKKMTLKNHKKVAGQ